ncbi:polymer-forming cytoskeletal protein [Polaromonas sp.]|uniref:bactofilin family protein n=1 Tax=Polaromonas sp. TaxID=1869339 RepID=UPI00352AA308
MSDTAFGPQKKPLTLLQRNAMAGRSPTEALESLELSLSDHRICMVIPAGSKIDALTMDLQGGLLILGALRASVTCATGSVIIAKGGEFQGSLKANDVIIEGRITSPLDASGRPQPATISQVHARGQVGENGAAIGGIIALASGAYVCGKLKAVSYSIPRSADLSRSTMETVAPSAN